MRSESNRRRGRRRQRRRTLYLRATVIVFNQDDEVLLVKRNGQNEWALPGGDVVDAEDTERSLIEVEGLEEEIGEQMTQIVMEDTGVHTTQMLHAGRYTDTAAIHEVYLAPGSGEPRPDHREIQDAIWWDRIRPLQVQPHVNAILEMIDSIEVPDSDEYVDVQETSVVIEEVDDIPLQAQKSVPRPEPRAVPPVDKLPASIEEQTQVLNTDRSPTWALVLATMWSWTVVVALLLADALIWVMLITRSGERRIRPTERKLRLSKERRRELMRQYNYTCVYCGRRRIARNLEIDHIIPLDRGGLDDVSNLQVTCGPCNRRKLNQTDEEFRGRYSRLVPATPLTPPNRPISEKEFNEETKRTSPVASTREFRKTRYISSREKIVSGCLIAGGIVTVLVAYGLVSIGAEGLLMAIPALVVGGAVGFGIWLRADMTGATSEDEG